MSSHTSHYSHAASPCIMARYLYVLFLRVQMAESEMRLCVAGAHQADAAHAEEIAKVGWSAARQLRHHGRLCVRKLEEHHTSISLPCPFCSS